MLIYMKPIDCRKILIQLLRDLVERIDDLSEACDTCLKSFCLSQAKQLPCGVFPEFNLLPVDKLLIIDAGIGGKKITKNYLNT